MSWQSVLTYWSIFDRKYPIYQLWRVISGGGWCIWIIVSALVPFWDSLWVLSVSRRCLTIQYVRPGTRAWQYSWWWYHSKLEFCWNIANNQTKCPLTESWFIILIGPWYRIVCRNANASMWCVAGDIGLLMVTSCYSFIVPIVQQVYPCFIGVQCRVWHPISSMLIIQMYRQFRHPWGHLIKIFTQQIGEIIFGVETN